MAYNVAYEVDGAWTYATQLLNVDADGAPSSYRVDGQGLSFTCDGVAAIENGRQVHPSDPDWESKCAAAWRKALQSGNYQGVKIFGFLTDNGVPVVQRAPDPLPGQAYISTTYMEIASARPGTQSRYVDAAEIPYVVLSDRLRKRARIEPGAVAAVYRSSKEVLAFAVFADTGGNLDEGSVRLLKDLGGSPVVVKSGTPRAKNALKDEIAIVVFPDHVVPSDLDHQAWRRSIRDHGTEALDKWGGKDRLDACLRDLRSR